MSIDRILKILCFCAVMGLPSPVIANSEIEALLDEKEPPAGIVFEIVSGQHDLLDSLLPKLRGDIKRLRSHFPGLPIAIVSHGSEQFALTSKNRKKEQQTHDLVKQLVESNQVDVHVCGTHAEWYGVMPEDFPEYVDVSAAGPAQINDYEELGYQLIVLP